MPRLRPQRDLELVQITDRALADATVRSGAWLACGAGCAQCCVGIFAINTLDAARLRQGMTELDLSDPERANRVRRRAADSWARLQRDFPGDSGTGTIASDAASRARFETFADDEPCPALDPDTQTCDLYAHRPMTCRIFGPPVRQEVEGEVGFSTCELCFIDAPGAEVLRCEVKLDEVHALESELLQQMGSGSQQLSGDSPETIVAFVLAQE